MSTLNGENVVTAGVLAFVGMRLVTGVQRSFTDDGRSLFRVIVKRIGWRHVWPVPIVLAGVVAVAETLLLIPGLDWGWWSALGGQGNPVFGTSDSTAGTVLEWVIPAVFVALLIPALPLFAFAEERMFRSGAEDWSGRKRVTKVLQFGLVHALIGIPIGTAIALSVGGAYFMRTYLHAFARTGSRAEATFESARAHTAYNAVIVVVVIVTVLLAVVL
jgi:hypothetical protein